MTDSCEIAVEVGGSVEIVNAEEMVTESRRASIAKEKSAEQKTSRRRDIEKRVVWKTFKIIVFLICLIFLIIQSVQFLNIYPTKIILETTVQKEVKLPAVTLCFRNTVSYQKFCSYHPERCERPKNSKEFCRERPSDCRGDTLKIPIPIQDELNGRNMKHYLLNDSYNDASLFLDYNYTSKARTFVRDIEYDNMLFKCYSENLHLYQNGLRPKTLEVDSRGNYENFFAVYKLDQEYIDLFYPKNVSQVFVAIHSPFVPIDPMQLHAIRPEKVYRIAVELEKEEHLLPLPYETNCSDNGPSDDAKESTHPNSFQMCQEMCRSEFAKEVSGCDWGMTMVSSISNLCDVYLNEYEFPNEQKRELEKKQRICKQNCKQGCLKLQYKYEITESPLSRSWRAAESFKIAFVAFTSACDDEKCLDRRCFFKFGRRKITLCEISTSIELYVKNPEVTVLRHVPVYSTIEIFSHIGGLLGCWLGISVFTFTDVIEKIFQKVVKWKRRFRKRKVGKRIFNKRIFGKRIFRKKIFRKRKEQRAPTSEIHQD